MLGWSRKPKDYLGDISLMLREMGFQHQKRENNSLSVHCVSKNGTGFDIHFFMHEDELVFESPYRKSVSGSDQNVATFYEMLLAYNSKMTKIHFSLVQGRVGWIILLRGAAEYKTITPESLYNLFTYFDFAYTTFIPEIEDLVFELSLSFTGNSLIDNMYK